MLDYPKIYSLSTVGIRQHFCTDYLIHPLRTDFTGNNGLGKSIISDLMQLIFIPTRDMWKPGTEGIDKNERRIEGLPLSREFIHFAYTFLNIEKSRGKFIVAGIYIPKTSRLPVRPFIIQQSDDFDGKQVVPFDFPLKHSDFIGENNVIPDLKELKQILKTRYNLHLKDFHHTEGIRLYYELLYKNYLLPIDLTKHGNLRAYAKILQSYSRAKTLDITSSKSLQNFLFEENEEIRQLFDDQKDKLESYIKQYRENLNQIKDLELKQQKLTSLKGLFDKTRKMKDEFLKADTFLALKNLKEAQLGEEHNRKRLEFTEKSFEKNQKELKKCLGKLHAEYQLLQRSGQNFLSRFTEMKDRFSDDQIADKRGEANRLQDNIRELEAISPLVEKYGSIDAMEKMLEKQSSMREKKTKLSRIVSIPSFTDFNDSLWVKDEFASATKAYNEEIASLNRQVDQLSNLLDLFEGYRSESFFHWAIDNKKPLTLAQESLLMHLKELAVSKPGELIEGFKYATDPHALLDSFEEEGGGIWIVMGHLREYVPYVKKQRFNDPENLKAVIEKDSSEIRERLDKVKLRIDKITTLFEELTAIGYNSEMAEIFKEKSDVESFEINVSLNEEKVEKAKTAWNEIGQLSTMREKFSILDNETIAFAKQQIEIENKIQRVTGILKRCNEQLETLKLEGETLGDIGNDKLPMTNDELAETNKENFNIENFDLSIKEFEDRINRLSLRKTNLLQTLSSEKGTMDGCRALEPLLLKELTECQNGFDTKKALFEKELSLNFDDILLSIDYSQEDVVKLCENSMRLQKEYQTEFTRVTEAFEETRGNRSPDLQTDEFNFHTLLNVLCGKLALEGLSPELERLNDELKKFGELQLSLILELFKKVELQYSDYKKLITELNFFFKENKISGLYHFQIDFNERKDILIDWVGKMREKAREQRLGSALFTPTAYLPGDENSPEKLIVGLARSFSAINNCEITDLLNPKFYFDLRVGLYDEQANRFSGSGGEAYTALALLCIGRLSVIQRDSFRPGVRFIIIEELSNIDDTNFGLFPEVANQFGYQLLTMTPKPFGSYSESEWFLHMLIRGKEKDINYKPMSFFRTKNVRQKLEEYLTPSGEISGSAFMEGGNSLS